MPCSFPQQDTRLFALRQENREALTCNSFRMLSLHENIVFSSGKQAKICLDAWSVC